MNTRNFRLSCAVLVALSLSAPAFAQTPAPAPVPGSGAVVTTNPDGTTTVSPSSAPAPSVPKDPSKAKSVRLNFPIDSSLMVWVKFFADLRRMNFIITDVKELENKKVTIISNQDVSPDAAWEAFMSALQAAGYSLRQTGSTARIVKIGTPGVGEIGSRGESDAYVTQLIQLENTRVDDMSKIIQNMVSAEGKIVAYPPTNTLIITDTSANIRKLSRIMKELDVASPRSTMVIYPLKFADAADVKGIIEQLYGVADESRTSAADRSAEARGTRSTTRPQRTTGARRPEAPATGGGEATTAGDESKFIAQVIEDERTNSLIVLANEDGHAAVRELLLQIDRDIDVGGEIHVVTLEHAKAEDVANVLSSLSQEGRRGGTQNQNAAAAANRANPAAPGARQTGAVALAGADGAGEGSAAAAFDNGMRIAPDESTNSLVIIASPADFQVIQRVIDELDVERKQVFVDAVIMELSSDDALDLGLAAHLPTRPSADSVGFVGAQLGASSLGLTTDALSGLALGVFGPSIDVPLADGSLFSVPAFGVVLNAIKTSGSTNIISNPSLMVLDNEEASIVVGRKIPFPTTSGLNNLGQPVISFQREDVAITLELTPRVNSENFVTLELKIEVQEVEDSAQSQSVSAAGGGFITSQRKLETMALIADNQTMVIGGLVGTTEGRSEAKVPILGDIPLIGALFRSSRVQSRKTNLIVFLTPHIVDEPDDMVEIQRVKEAQRQEFLRRFYGKSREEFWRELQDLLQYSMNFVDERSVYRGPSNLSDLQLDGQSLSDETRDALQDAIDEGHEGEPGEGAGDLPPDDQIEIDDGTAPAPL